jgi:hypothetical protein
MTPEGVALLAGLFAAACPIAMQMGTTAQPEPLFALLVLGCAIAFERAAWGTAAALLGAAVMLRYEAWAVLATAAALLAFDAVWGRGRRRPMSWRALLVVAVPLALIVGWAALRRPVDGKWFGFLRQTQDFANEALRQKSVLSAGVKTLARDALYYPVFVPLRVLGGAMVLVPFGVARTVRDQGARFVLLLAAPLGFVSLSWITRAMLGLDRHFVCIVPLYATFAAQGAASMADAAARLGRHLMGPRGAALWGRSVAGLLACGALAGLAVQLDVWMGFWRASVARGWPERTAIAAYLRSLPSGSVVFCDEATIEIPSGLDRRRFDRHWIDDPHTWDLIQQTARERGAVYVATWRRKLQGHERVRTGGARRSPALPGLASAVTGEIVFRAGDDPAQEETTGVAVMRVAPDEGAAQR